MKIKTLAEILAESEADSASTPISTPKQKTATQKQSANKANNANNANNAKQSFSKSKYSKSSQARSMSRDDDSVQKSVDNCDSLDDSTTTSIFSEHSFKPSKTKSKKRKKRFHPAANFEPEPSDVPAYQPPEPQSIKEMLAEVKRHVDDSTNADSHKKADATDDSQTDTDNLPSALKAYLRTPEQKQAEIDAIKAESRLRWLAFYYLSRREYGKAELKQKLLDKEQDPDKIDALLSEFEEKGYQSDYRTTLMLIRESIRKGRGRGRIRQEFYTKKIAMPSNIDELIDMANTESDEFSEFVDDSEDSLVDGVDWLKLAVSARVKKYGNNVPTEQKEKAKQLRFLQYRGFNMDICFQALNYTLDTLDERF